MKQIIIFLLLIIVGLIGYGQYKKHKRYSFSEYEYKVPDGIDVANANKGLLLDYYEAVETVNGFVATKWSAENIDVRNPSDDDAEDMAAVSEYRNRLANVKFYEAQLVNPKTEVAPVKDSSEAEKKKQLIKSIFNSNPIGNSLRLGERSAMVYEIQGLLIAKGDSIVHDGLFRAETFTSLKNFEEKHKLFPDGRLDAITLEYLLK
ncbi:peptidoglycan-binding domain-containing protein [Ulvibacter antarcticus]|uniref:Putative peptidoglycan binding protein n=1 Tax=Ulvibacter antarcticus TaxID=442714 RepID=A0A3L9YZL2_9FLAO|nr:peptidoglycan-binding domain-containing protein [Ulvibacter antarcticus]RMA66076.1 putative peptidoglycan binding protein [Ulvibacter antarcticus]